MSDDTEFKFPQLTLEKNPAAEASAVKLNKVRAMKKLTPPGEWTLMQQLVQEIYIDFIIRTGVSPTYTQLLKELPEIISFRYDAQDEETTELKQLLLDTIPSVVTINSWNKKEEWNKTIWDKVKATGLFSKEKRAQMINSLHQRGMEKDTAAAKIWLTLSGDYSDRPPEEKLAVTETFRQINSILQKKNQ